MERFEAARLEKEQAEAGKDEVDAELRRRKAAQRAASPFAHAAHGRRTGLSIESQTSPTEQA